MKRTRIVRRTRPERKTRLIPAGPPARNVRLNRTGDLPRVSARRRKRDAYYDAQRQAVYDRAGGRCEFREADGWARCCQPMVDVHHLAGRVGPDPHRLSNLIGLCRHHHDQAHAHPAWAYEVGLLVRRHGGDVA